MTEGTNPVAPEVPVVATPQAEPQTIAPPEIDYEKLASIVAGKTSVTEKKVINGYLKQQGLDEASFDEAIQLYHNYKASQTPSVEGLQSQISEYEAALDEAYSDQLYAQAELEAYKAAAELGVDGKTVPYLMRMADLSNVVVDGQIDLDVLKENLSNVLNDLPQLKNKIAEDQGAGGFKIGADTSKQDPNQLNTELAKIFGVDKKKG